MKLDKLIKKYVDYRQSLGEKFKTNEAVLKKFCRSIGPSVNIKLISNKMVSDFLYRKSIITSGWFVDYNALLGFYRYAFIHNYVSNDPLPKVLPKLPRKFVPYIYSPSELKRLFDTALTYQKINSHISPYMVRTVLILTYALGLRIHETLSIELKDINIDLSCLTISDAKFYKSRLVPFNLQIKEIICTYLKWRIKNNQPQYSTAYLFIGKGHQPFNIATLQYIFKRIRKKAGIKRKDATSYQPRIHDLRHTFAVHRLTSWYRENKNIQQLLPILSVYLGHSYLASTSIYLTMTDELLYEANKRFEKYVRGEQQ